MEAVDFDIFYDRGEQLRSQDTRDPLTKTVDLVLSILRELRYMVGNVYNRCWAPTSQYDSWDQEKKWETDSKALFVFLHGLRGHPSIWDTQISLLKGQQVDIYVPFIPKAGECSLQEAVTPILGQLGSFARRHPKTPIVINGVSNGSRLATDIEVEFRALYPDTPIRVSTIAGVHFGSPLIGLLKKWGLARWLCSDIIQQELAWEAIVQRGY